MARSIVTQAGGLQANVSVTVSGDKAVIRALEALPKRVRNKVVRQAVRKGMKLMKERVAANMPVDTGIARSSLVVRVSKMQKRGVVMLDVLYDTEKLARSFTEHFYPATIEYGAVSQNRKPVAPMRRAFDEEAQSIKDAAMREIAAGAEREAAALNNGPTF